MIKLAQDTIDSKDLQALSLFITEDPSPQLTMGERVKKFEKNFSAWMGMDYGAMVNSGSSANLLMLSALIYRGDLSPGDKVVIPSIAWATDLSPVIQLGLVPVLCDVNRRNACICPIELENTLKEHNPKALILISTLGMPPDMEEIDYLCRKHNCILLEDNCEGLGSTYSDCKLGTWGLMSTTSMYWGHHISTIEGGMVFTKDPDLYDILRMIRAHGWDRNIDPERAVELRAIHGVSEFNSRYTFYYPGYNFRPTEIAGFLGYRQLLKIDDFIKIRKQNFDFFQYYIKNNYWKPEIAKEHFVSNLGYPVIHPKRDRIAQALTDAGVECRPFISGNMARQPIYLKWIMDNGQLTMKEAKEHSDKFLNAEEIHKFGMYVPNHPFLKEEDLYTIYSIINKVINN